MNGFLAMPKVTLRGFQRRSASRLSSSPADVYPLPVLQLPPSSNATSLVRESVVRQSPADTPAPPPPSEDSKEELARRTVVDLDADVPLTLDLDNAQVAELKREEARKEVEAFEAAQREMEREVNRTRMQQKMIDEKLEELPLVDVQKTRHDWPAGANETLVENEEFEVTRLAVLEEDSVRMRRRCSYRVRMTYPPALTQRQFNYVLNQRRHPGGHAGDSTAVDDSLVKETMLFVAGRFIDIGLEDLAAAMQAYVPQVTLRETDLGRLRDCVVDPFDAKSRFVPGNSFSFWVHVDGYEVWDPTGTDTGVAPGTWEYRTLAAMLPDRGRAHRNGWGEEATE
ncbi:unnamed protein product [Vitrella brassicaformis CCMP3155]|uniref:Uncharacterized protein n=1 Tax=Vitrella brassicaformis (strain CCMP3155) TaxID=1169540 RepID=A0A0G4E8I9_VITBC|nr:unnamed protein product [Vitrella brassicaformis CCMP3155]|eukprot:CEL91653.1 unnamed protein product [Vitrella brassicaformis CCMP3155]